MTFDAAHKDALRLWFIETANDWYERDEVRAREARRVAFEEKVRLDWMIEQGRAVSRSA